MMTLVVFLGVLSVLVLVHELGHFVAARMLGIKVEEFAFGLPFTPPLFKIRRGETQYAIYPLFFGGFVRMYGEEKEVNVDRGVSFWWRGKRERIAVILAGVVMNLVLAMGLFVVLYTTVGVPQLTVEKVTIVGVLEESPAAMAGVVEGDRVVAVEGKRVGSLDEFSELMKSWAGVGVNVTIERGEGTPLFEGIVEKVTETQVVTMVPRANPPEGEGALGVVIASYPYVETSECGVAKASCVAGALKQGLKSTEIWIGRVFDGLRLIGQSLLAGKAPEGVSGPVGIYQLTGLVAAEGWLPLVEFVAILSVNLAVFNVLPIPALDGGRLLFVLWELVARKRMSQRLEQRINGWGMAFLLAVMVVVSLQDVVRLGVLEKLFTR